MASSSLKPYLRKVPGKAEKAGRHQFADWGDVLCKADWLEWNYA